MPPPNQPVSTVRRIRSDEWRAFKELRLGALRDSPTAFGSTYEKEREVEDGSWQERGRGGADSDGRALYVADVDGGLRGMAWGVIDEDEPQLAHLYGMFVTPAFRGRGIGRELVDSVLSWARSRRARKVVLDVTDVNAPAVALYVRCGFVRTGRTQPLPHTPTLTEIEMERDL